MYKTAAMIINKVIITKTTTTIVVVLLSPSGVFEVVGLKPLVVVNLVEYWAKIFQYCIVWYGQNVSYKHRLVYASCKFLYLLEVLLLSVEVLWFGEVVAVLGDLDVDEVETQGSLGLKQN